jgi:tetratricopeptide (TPR) repeat protein
MPATKNDDENGESKMGNKLRATICFPRAILHLRFWLFAVLMFALAGCTPPGPRALLRGKRLLDEGRIPEAIENLETATSLLNTNAIAWNYLGVAYQQAGNFTNALQAYVQALKLDRDLVETHFDLGCLWLEQNRLDYAKAEFAAFTMHRPAEVQGWLKLGSTQFRSRELSAAEKSFNEALRLSPQNPEALNGLGLIQLQRNRVRDAAQRFSDALKQKPDYAPALLNLAIVSQLYLNDKTAALQKYREYLALSPRPANFDDVNAVAVALERELNPASRPAVSAPAIPNSSTAKPPAKTESRAVAETNVPKIASATASENPTSAVHSTEVASGSNATNKPPKRGFFERLFHRNSNPAPGGVSSKSEISKPDAEFAELSSAAGNVPRYHYHSIAKPAPGNRAAAEKFFTQGLEWHRMSHLPEAMDAYLKAAQADPTYFEAYYNLSLAALAAGNLPQALSASENALAIRSDSADARINFAQALRQAGFPLDAAEQLTVVLSKNPNDARANLAMGNLCAQEFHQPAKARAHYLKVLEIDPQNSQASAIRDWLVANPR